MVFSRGEQQRVLFRPVNHLQHLGADPRIMLVINNIVHMSCFVCVLDLCSFPIKSLSFEEMYLVHHWIEHDSDVWSTVGKWAAISQLPAPC